MNKSVKDLRKSMHLDHLEALTIEVQLAEQSAGGQLSEESRLAFEKKIERLQKTFR